MGAADFSNFQAKTKTITTAKEAFRELQAAARHEYGNQGYTGTIAEKSEYKNIRSSVMEMHEAVELMEELMDDETIGDKWGPAGCLAISDGQYGEGWLFFGTASC